MPANIDITINTFNDILVDKVPVTADLSMSNVHPRVSINAQGEIVVKPKQGVLDPKEVSIVFTVANSKEYFPVGIAFKRPNSATNDERVGFGNFDQAKHKPKRVTFAISDEYTDTNPKVRFKFNLLVQRGSDGAIGIIDPIIIHEPPIVPPPISARRS